MELVDRSLWLDWLNPSFSSLPAGPHGHLLKRIILPHQWKLVRPFDRLAIFLHSKIRAFISLQVMNVFHHAWGNSILYGGKMIENTLQLKLFSIES